MRLITLGGLRLEGSEFNRPQPLLLLAYLALEGPKARQQLGELFWWDASNPRNSLSSTLTRVRTKVPNVIEADKQRVWVDLVNLETDFQDLQTALKTKDYNLAVQRYTGLFLDGFYLSDLGEELEEWLYNTRENTANQIREAYLHLAEKDASQGNFKLATEFAEEAYTLAGCTPLEPEELHRFHSLLLLNNSSHLKDILQEADSYGISLSQSQQEAKIQLKRLFIGRGKELERLETLEIGNWAWVKGGAGIGKSSLLKNLDGTHLAGRSGLPYVTLEPILSDSIKDGAEAILKKILHYKDTLIIDDWEQVDQESKTILERLKGLKPQNKVVISSNQAPEFAIDVLMELGPLQREELAGEESLFEKTGGLPRLVNARLKGESLTEAFEVMLSGLNENTQRVYLSLSLLEKPDLSLVRQGLALSPQDMSEALKTLSTRGFTDLSGQLWSLFLARDYLEDKPYLVEELSIKLARLLKGVDAFPLYQASKTMWADEDLEEVQEAYLAWAKELMERGFPQRAADVLVEVPANGEISFMRGYALERNGNYKEAFEYVSKLEETDRIIALKANLYRRLGETEKAQELAKSVLEGGMWARAQALNVLGEIARDIGEYDKAVKFYKRATVLWKSQSNNIRAANSLNNIGVVYHLCKASNGMIEDVFQDALNCAGENIRTRSIILMNLALEWARNNEYLKAEQTFFQVVKLATDINLTYVLIRNWNNLGFFYHTRDEKEKAKHAYNQALVYAKEAGEQVVFGTTLANIAELNEDFESWLEAISVLRNSGQYAMIKSFWSDLPPEHVFRTKQMKIAQQTEKALAI